MQLGDLDQYDFNLPKELLRSEGVEPRDSARLFVYDTKTNTVHHDIFRNLGRYLPKEATLVFNKTRVLPARMWMQKNTGPARNNIQRVLGGGRIEVFVLVNEWQGNKSRIPVKVDRKIAVGEILSVQGRVLFVVEEQTEDIFWVRLLEPQQSLEQILYQYGSTPIPPYLKENNQTEADLRDRYQTVFAESGASVAAPTASLHFTKELICDLQKNDVKIACLSLEVGLGTFAPLSQENFSNNTLHTEYVTVDQKILEVLKQENPLIPVGTTALRAIESIAMKGIQKPGTFATNIFITPGYQFTYPAGLVTNFHTPKSSLMLLVDAFLGHKGAERGIMSLYQEALEERYTFYSFGDSMLIL
jgi:S-adenosylmethionine:tRNA ribosyltransferase-isomerase